MRRREASSIGLWSHIKSMSEERRLCEEKARKYAADAESAREWLEQCEDYDFEQGIAEARLAWADRLANLWRMAITSPDAKRVAEQLEAIPLTRERIRAEALIAAQAAAHAEKRLVEETKTLVEAAAVLLT